MLVDDHAWVKHYRPPTRSPWRGASDKTRFHQLFRCDDLRKPLPTENEAQHFGLIGFASDEGVKRNHGRTGAAEGPRAFREHFGKQPANMSCSTRFFDIGDIVCDDGDLESSQEALGKTVAFLKAQNIFPIVIGGGHEMAFGHYLGLREAYPDATIHIVNIDAHFDLRSFESKGSSGTPFLQMHDDCQKRSLPFAYSCFGIQTLGNTKALFEKAEELGVHTVTAETIHRDPDFLVGECQKIIEKGDSIYLTLCLDVFAAPFAPGVSAPQPMGLCPWDISPVIQFLAQSGKVVGFDLAELNPKFDLDSTTARLAGALCSQFIHNFHN